MQQIKIDEEIWEDVSKNISINKQDLIKYKQTNPFLLLDQVYYAKEALLTKLEAENQLLLINPISQVKMWDEISETVKEWQNKIMPNKIKTLLDHSSRFQQLSENMINICKIERTYSELFTYLKPEIELNYHAVKQTEKNVEKKQAEIAKQLRQLTNYQQLAPLFRDIVKEFDKIEQQEKIEAKALELHQNNFKLPETPKQKNTEKTIEPKPAPAIHQQEPEEDEEENPFQNPA